MRDIEDYQTTCQYSIGSVNEVLSNNVKLCVGERGVWTSLAFIMLVQVRNLVMYFY